MKNNTLILLQNWLPIILSILSIAFSMRSNKKNAEQNRNLEAQKEVLKLQEIRTNEINMRLNNRSNLIPFFSLILDDSNIKIETTNDCKNIELTIELINIGKESATNISIYPMKKREPEEYSLENYFETVNEKNNYFIRNYLNQRYAFPKESIKFTLTRKIPKSNENNDRISNIIKFKIRFQDLRGNLYEQEFQFSFDEIYKFSLESYSSIPNLINEQ